MFTREKPTMNVDQVETALHPISEILAADGYELSLVMTGTDNIRVEVHAGPDVCEDCLIPKDSFIAIASKYLNDQGISPTIEVIYPSDSHR